MNSKFKTPVRQKTILDTRLSRKKSRSKTPLLELDMDKSGAQFKKMKRQRDDGSPYGSEDEDLITEEHLSMESQDSISIQPENDDTNANMDVVDEVDHLPETPLGNRLNKIMQSVLDDLNASEIISNNMFAEIQNLEGKSVEEMLKLILKVQQEQLTWMSIQTRVMVNVNDEIHRPCMKLIAELGTRRQRKLFGKPTKTDSDWKNKGELIIQVGLDTYQVTDYDREEIKQLVVVNQDSAIWTEPTLGDLPLKEIIQSSLHDYFGMIDEPRKLGYVVAQFLRPQEYFKENFFLKYYTNDSHREPKKAENRKNVSECERKLFSDIVLYIGGKLVVEYPDTKTKKRSGGHTVQENKRLEFVNNARDAVNQAGLLQKDGAKEKPNYMDHLEGFVPLLEREEYKQKLQSLIEEENARADKENAKNKRNNFFSTPSSSRLKQNLPKLRHSPMDAKEALRKAMEGSGTSGSGKN